MTPPSFLYLWNVRLLPLCALNNVIMGRHLWVWGCQSRSVSEVPAGQVTIGEDGWFSLVCGFMGSGWCVALQQWFDH
uniref:Uncharacterized protein n=1 Tax=Arundo donax TaxID=35708 RepID=A0A0A9DAX4_ARUDO